MNGPTRFELPVPDATVAVVGLGTIGSFFVDAIARHARVRRLILVDRDACELPNLGAQRVAPEDCAEGRPKVEVQAEHVRRVRPDVEVVCHYRDVADLPLGCLRAHLVVAGLDSLAARLHLNTAVFRLGTPWLDGGVQPGAGLVRVTGYRPGLEGPCFECALVDEDYERRLGSIHPCAIEGAEGRTRGTAGTGALAGALLAATAEGFLAGVEGAQALFGKESLLDAHHHVHALSAFRRNPMCRFDHLTWEIRPLRDVDLESPLGDLLSALTRAAGAPTDAPINLSGRRLAERAQCPRCGHARAGWHLTGRLPMRERGCPACAKGRLEVAGFTTLPLAPALLPSQVLALPLARLGIAAGDVLEVRGERETTRWELMPGEAHESRPKGEADTAATRPACAMLPE